MASRLGMLIAVVTSVLFLSVGVAVADSIACKSQGNRDCNGTSGNDIIDGTLERDVIDARAGNDRVNAGQGDDTVRGSLGIDALVGGMGSDKLYGGAGPDVLSGGDGRDWLYGEEADHSIDAKDEYYGDDILYAGDGADYLIDNGISADKLYGQEGYDVIDARDNVLGNDTVVCGPGSDAAWVDTEDEADGDCEQVTVAFPSKEVGAGVLVKLNPPPRSPCPLGTHTLADEHSGEVRQLTSDSVNLDDYDGQRVTVFGAAIDVGGDDPNYECYGTDPIFYVTRVEEEPS